MTGLGWWHLSDTERNSKHWVNMCMSEVLQTVGTHFSLGKIYSGLQSTIL